ncbi:uncharacterized protein CANTADRAFT_34211, partial [Suhomyces tanzawaensis NRRL Y-17324]
MLHSSRPVTPSSQAKRRQLQRSSGLYLLTQSPKIHYPVDVEHTPMESAVNSEKFGRVSDAMEELDVNMTNLQLIHDAVALGFNESFASFMYGLSITMWCVDFPGCPTRKAWEELQEQKACKSRIDELQSRLRRKKEENETLKSKLETLSKPKPKEATIIRPTRPPVRQRTKIQNTVSRPSVPAARPRPSDDDSYTTNEGSFVANPIDKRNRLSRIPAPPVPTTRSRSPEVSKRGPNLNQPPRYMRGLFDSSNTAR